MEGVINPKGLFSLPSNPQTRVFHPLQSLRPRFPIKSSHLLGFSPLKVRAFSPNPSEFSPRNPLFSGPQSNRESKRLLLSTSDKSLAGHGLWKREEKPLTCSAGAAIPAGGASFNEEEKEKAKFLGVEFQTLKKIIPLGIMFFCILFNYTILRDTKDVLVVTAKGSSAEIIPFLKTWVNLPMAVGFMLLYTKLSNVLSKEALFYTVIFPFIAFFGAFAFVMYPLSSVIHPTALADKLVAALGPSFVGPVAILRIWSFCLFYVMAELWGSVVISVLFWGFANQITTVEEAKEFYPLFGLGV
ncbi:hypothetical protein J5N97_006348 [Dioscorea zingiberensis]|uniref:ADP,ATP carrier protein n=1 Tax=Dioscorea zingiberensis TaxID=325984 RepID=A0A9D5HTY0_9LILI|nr:hypothetical protein J5N97_006348 [Dioscorea zingiberensis]